MTQFCSSFIKCYNVLKLILAAYTVFNYYIIDSVCIQLSLATLHDKQLCTRAQ